MELEEEVVGMKAEAERLQSRVESRETARQERAAQAAEAEARAAGAGAALERERQGRQAADLELLRARDQVARLEDELAAGRASLRDCAAEISQGLDDSVILGTAAEGAMARCVDFDKDLKAAMNALHEEVSRREADARLLEQHKEDCGHLRAEVAMLEARLSSTKEEMISSSGTPVESVGEAASAKDTAFSSHVISGAVRRHFGSSAEFFAVQVGLGYQHLAASGLALQ